VKKIRYPVGKTVVEIPRGLGYIDGYVGYGDGDTIAVVVSLEDGVIEEYPIEALQVHQSTNFGSGE